MKKAIFTFVSVLCTCLMFAQAPQKFNYQAVARNASGVVLLNQNVKIQASVLEGSPSGTSLYSETHSVTTHAKTGLFNLAIGGGSVVSGNFAGITWGSGNKYLKIEMDATGNGNFDLVGTSQLLSVPYALYAEKAKSSSLAHSFLLQSQAISIQSTMRGSSWSDVKLSNNIAITQLEVPETGTYLLLCNLKITDTLPGDEEFQMQVLRVNDNDALIQESTIFQKSNSTVQIEKGELATWTMIQLTAGQLLRLQYRMIGNTNTIAYSYSHAKLALIKIN